MKGEAGERSKVARRPSSTSAETARQALLTAQDRFLHWLDQVEPAFVGQGGDLATFNAIAKAAKALRIALGGASDELGAERRMLVAFLQDEFDLWPKREFDEQLGYLDEMLGCLERVDELGTKPGPMPDKRAQVWVWIAADCWLEVAKQSPAGGGRAGFWKALQIFWSDPARSVRLPSMSEQTVKTALVAWHKRRELLAG